MHADDAVQYPLTELVRLLAFEDDTEAREFCEHHGLTVTSDGLVHMGKTGFVHPEMAFPMRRAARLIQSKQTASLGEVCATFSCKIYCIVSISLCCLFQLKLCFFNAA